MSATPRYLVGKQRVSSFVEVDEILRSAEFVAGGTEQESVAFRGRTLLELDGPEHRARRKLETPLFARAMLERYERAILAPAIERCLAEAAASGRGADGLVRADLAQVSQRMFLQIAAAVIGLDGVDTAERTEQLEQCMLALNEAFDVKYSTRDHDAVVAEGLVAKRRFVELFYRPSVERRAALPPDDAPLDLLTLMLRHHGADWDDDLPVREAILYLAGATSTTSNAINHAVADLQAWLVAHPSERALLDDRTFLRGVCNEALRLHPNVTALVRRASRELTLSTGRTFRAGEYVALDLVAASHDSAVFGDDAAEFNPHRTVPPGVRPYGVAFGMGRHLCIGLPLVTTAAGTGDGDDRAMLRILRALLDAGITLDPDRPPRFAPTAEDVYASLPVLLTNR